MKKIFENFITEEEKDLLMSIKVNSSDKLKDHENKNEYGEDVNKVISKILTKLKDEFKVEVGEKSYFRLESSRTGHKWHVDIGTNGHMSWCTVGASILLQEPVCKGGTTYYGTEVAWKIIDIEELQRNVCDLVAHTSDEWHMVKPNEGERFAFLLFI